MLSAEKERESPETTLIAAVFKLLKKYAQT